MRSLKTMLPGVGLLLVSLTMPAVAQYPGDLMLGHMESGKLYMQILRNTNNQPPHDPLRLAEAFEISGKRHGVSPRLLAAIASVESGYFVGAINARTADYGIMQINALNIKHYKFSKKRLLTDIEYSVDAGAKVLSWFAKKYKGKEADWFCRYNVGTRKLEGSLARICKQYAAKVRRAL